MRKRAKKMKCEKIKFNEVTIRLTKEEILILLRLLEEKITREISVSRSLAQKLQQLREFFDQIISLFP